MISKISKVLIFGYYGKKNLGDEAILSIIISRIKRLYKNGEIKIISYNKQDTKDRHKIDAINNREIGSVLLSIMKSTHLLIGGGGFRFEKIIVVLYELFLLVSARIMFKKAIFCAGGIEQIQNYYMKIIIRNMFSLFNYIAVRDEQSKKNLEAYGVKKYIEVIRDPVFLFDPNESARKSNIIQIACHKRSPIIGVSILNANNASKYRGISSIYANLINHLTDKIKAYVVLVSMSPKEGDKDLIIKIMNEVNNKDKIIAYTNAQDILDIYNLCSQLDVAIGMRYHFLLIAALRGVPIAGISRSPKVDSLIKNLSQCMLGSYKDYKNIVNNVERFWLDRRIYRKKIIELMPSQIEKARKIDNFIENVL